MIHKSLQKESTKGFTLIELLIAIAIIGILASVLIPNLIRAREHAYDTTVQSYLHQVAMQAEIYHMDHETYPADFIALANPAYGIDPAPANITLGIATSGTMTNYVFCAQHNNSSTVFEVSPDNSIRLDSGSCP